MVLSELGLQKDQYALATIHRAGNTDRRENMRSILEAFGALPARIILPLHPRTRKLLDEYKLSIPKNVVQIDPVSYLDMLLLEENANCILTDSGGIQKEAYLLGIRCITLREDTEWVETVDSGWNMLVGADRARIIGAYEDWAQPATRPQFYGDGHAAQKILNILDQSMS